nr:site-specific integrase [Sulfobacillus harzensis]
MPTPDDVWALMTAAEQHSPFAAALVAFVFGTGCRISEVVATTWGAIIPGRTQWAWHVPHRTPNQVMPLRPEVVAALQRWRVAQGLPPTHWEREDPTPLFPTSAGEPMRPVALTATIRRLAVKAHLKAYPAFALRHAHAELALRHGASLTLLKRTLGHHRLSSTARYLRPELHLPAATSDFLPWKPSE